MLREVLIDTEAKTLTVVLDLEAPRLSGSGKNMVVASTRGNKVTDAVVNGQLVVVGCNAYIRPGR